MYKPYTEYKCAEGNFLSHIPIEWNMVRVSKLSNKITNGYVGPTRGLFVDQGVPYLQSLHIKSNRITFNPTYFVPAEWSSAREKSVLREGDVLVVQTGDVGQVACVPPEFAGANCHALIIISVKSERASGYFLSLFLGSSFGASALKRIQTGALHPHLNCSAVRDIHIPVPSLEEQTKIVKFLDYETAKIDELIEQQQQLIALLQEKRQAVISHAVTKGLNPDVPMRDSGVEWLGDVPAHWTVVRLKHACTIQSGMPKGNRPSAATIDMPMLRVANVQDGWLNLDDVHQIPVDRSQVKRYLLRDGDVLMNEGGDRDKLGRGVVWRGEVPSCIHQNHVFAIRPQSIEPDWLDAVTRADYAKYHFYRVAKQSTNLASISSSNVKETPLLVPPAEERQAILAHIQSMSAKNSGTIDLAERQCELLQERRAALISAAVTGKIDVRNWTPPESEPEEDAP